MRNRKNRSRLAGLLAAVLALTLTLGVLPTQVYAVTQDEIDRLEREKEAIAAQVEQAQAVVDELEAKQADAIESAITLFDDLLGGLVELSAELRRFVRREEAGVWDVGADDGDIHLPRVHGLQDTCRVIALIRQPQYLRAEVADQDAPAPCAFRVSVCQHIFLQDLREDVALYVDSHFDVPFA